ncbi:hypothetical protein EJ05DRAFT_512736 [Pseudovirgaria hyperparasitica]|uniref:Mitochondrial import inner membrane translocase subunit n=1 Tax=Pseudovirgaria hyperparasitica TaxID=470096 RepID=A0A6A6W3N1_9PEZI|nr:uncharacterized protein EJ05DRAFT_512736 [Pseudovirgaria hyperparasitica]KAF2756197.1 hypothetical protein EJ05DRAFT_512736 [Pseudovirgaria hyperparasitica]
MDSLGAASNLDFTKLSERDKQELQQFVVQESQKAALQSNIHKTTDMCFKKCVTSKISSAQLDRYEAPCMEQCVERFMDANKVVFKELDRMRALQ